jgi:membrane protein
MRVAKLWRVTINAIGDWWNDNCLRLAASLAFYTALSLAPLVLLIVGLASMVIDRQQAATQLAAQLESLMGSSGGELVRTILTTTTQAEGTIATIVSLGMLFIGATAVFGELQTTLNLIWEVQPAPSSGICVFSLAFLLLVSLVITAVITTITSTFQGAERTIFSMVLEFAVSVLVLTFVFALLFKYVPDAQIEWQDVWLGGFVSAVLFTVGKTAIGYYIGHASVGSAYGAAGSLVVLLVWVYYSSLIFFFGAEFTHAWAKQQHQIAPAAHATAGAAPQTKGAVEERR